MTRGTNEKRNVSRSVWPPRGRLVDASRERYSFPVTTRWRFFCDLVPGTLALDLPTWILWRLLFFLCHCLWPKELYLSRIKNQEGHLGTADVGQKERFNVKTTTTTTTTKEARKRRATRVVWQQPKETHLNELRRVCKRKKCEMYSC